MARHIYVHIPFCERKCPYCSFFSRSANEINDEVVVQCFESINLEIDLFAKSNFQDINQDAMSTIYFGGGTPSFVDAALICDTLTHIKDAFHLSNNTEITIEVNPASATFEKLSQYKKAGFNRISIGVQSLSDTTLKILGRLHDAQEATDTIENAKKAGFTNISADLIIGVPTQTLTQILKDAETLIESGVAHISMYSLSIEEGTRFFSLYKNTLEDYISQEKEREMYHELRSFLDFKGIHPYEISNCARKGCESRHNLSYWNACEYYAFGPGAHGYLQGVRFGNVDDVDEFVNTVGDMKVESISSLFRNDRSTKLGPIYVEECLSNEGKLKEYALLRLRTSEGIDADFFSKTFQTDFQTYFKNEIESNNFKGYTTYDGRSFKLTTKGLDFANQVFEDFI